MTPKGIQEPLEVIQSNNEQIAFCNACIAFGDRWMKVQPQKNSLYFIFSRLFLLQTKKLALCNQNATAVATLIFVDMEYKMVKSKY